MTAEPRYLSYPTRLDVSDFEAILAQAVDPEANYRVEGWILRAMADELLKARAGRQRDGRSHRHAAPTGQRTFLEDGP